MHVQVLDHFEWRYLVAFDMAIANPNKGTPPAEDDVSVFSHVYFQLCIPL